MGLSVFPPAAAPAEWVRLVSVSFFSYSLSVSPSLLSTFPSHIIRHAFPVATRAVPFHRRRCGLAEHGWGRWQLSKRLTCILCVFPFFLGRTVCGEGRNWQQRLSHITYKFTVLPPSSQADRRVGSRSSSILQPGAAGEPPSHTYFPWYGASILRTALLTLGTRHMSRPLGEQNVRFSRSPVVAYHPSLLCVYVVTRIKK